MSRASPVWGRHSFGWRVVSAFLMASGSLRLEARLAFVSNARVLRPAPAGWEPAGVDRCDPPRWASGIANKGLPAGVAGSHRCAQGAALAEQPPTVEQSERRDSHADEAHTKSSQHSKPIVVPPCVS